MNSTNTPPSTSELLGTLVIKTIVVRSVGGSWVAGTIAGHDFEALVFSEASTIEAYGIGGSRISKLWLRNNAIWFTVAEFDREWIRQPTNKAAEMIVDALVSGLAEIVFRR